MGRQKQEELDQIVSYIRHLYERKNTSLQRAGISQWAIRVSFVYVLWETANHVKENNFQPLDLSNILFSFYFIFIISALLWLLKPVRKPVSPFDLRLQKLNSYWSIVLVLIILCLIIMLGAGYLMQNPLVTGYVKIVLKIDYYLVAIGAILLALVGAAGVLMQYIAKTGIDVVTGNRTGKIYQVFMILLLSLLVINVHVLYIFLIHFPLQQSISYFLIGFDLFVLFILLIFWLTIDNNDYDLYVLQSLERDILLHGISYADAKDRLETHIIGVYLGDWIKEKMSELEARKNTIMAKLEYVEKLISEINQIPPDMKFEVKGRLDEYRKSLKVLAKDYKEPAVKLIDWFRAREIQYNADENFTGIYADVISKMANQVREIEKNLDDALDKIDTLEKELLVAEAK